MPDTFVKIATVTANNSSSNFVEFLSIPQIYTDLVVKVSARSSKGGTNVDNFALFFNGSTSSYPFRALYGNGSSASSGSGNSAYGMLLGTASTTTSSVFGNAEAYIPNYTNSSYYKSVSADNANENNATSSDVALTATIWENTAAITSIKVQAGGGNIEQYSTFYLYGIKNS